MIFAFAITTAGATILSAVIVAVMGIVVAIVQQGKLSHKVTEVHESLKTNHGKRPGEYLEMISDMAEALATLERTVHGVAVTVSDHTVADEVSFRDIRSAQTIAERKLGEQAQATVAAVNAAVRANVTAKEYHDEVMSELTKAKEALATGHALPDPAVRQVVGRDDVQSAPQP